VDPQSYHSFTYRIDFPDGTFYIGKRKLWVEKAKQFTKPSDWQDYWGSSKDVKAKVKTVGEANVSRTVLKWCCSAMDASWDELKRTIAVFEDPKCLNQKLLPNYRKNVIDGLNNEDRRDKYMAEVKKKREALAALRSPDDKQ